MGNFPRYGIDERLTVPDIDGGVQGLIVSLSGRQGGDFIYVVRFTHTDGAQVDTTFREVELRNANPLADNLAHVKSELAVANSQAITLRGTIDALQRKLQKATAKKKR